MGKAKVKSIILNNREQRVATQKKRIKAEEGDKERIHEANEALKSTKS